MLWVCGHYKYFTILLLLSERDRLQMSESGVYRRQILTTKVNPHTEMVSLTIYLIPSWTNHLNWEMLSFHKYKYFHSFEAHNNCGSFKMNA